MGLRSTPSIPCRPFLLSRVVWRSCLDVSVTDVLLYLAVAPSVHFSVALWVVLVTKPAFFSPSPFVTRHFTGGLVRGDMNPSVGFGVVLG